MVSSHVAPQVPSPSAEAAESARARLVAAAIHSGEMEGLSVTAPTREDAAAYVAGDIDADGLVERVRARYGLT